MYSIIEEYVLNAFQNTESQSRKEMRDLYKKDGRCPKETDTSKREKKKSSKSVLVSGG